jgi:hypothetical protein
MNKKNLFILTAVIGLLSCGGCCCDKPSTAVSRHQQRLIFVSDMDQPACYEYDGRLLALTDVHAFVDDYANTQVTTFMVHAGEQMPTYRSKYMRLVGDDDGGRLDCGTNTSLYNFFRRENRNILNLEKEGIDLVEAQLKLVKEKGMEAFLTFRVNDLHFTNPADGYTLTYTDFWLQHPEYWMNETFGWNTVGAYDHAHAEVRQYRLDIIFEQLERYGALIDGYDLDFQRFPVFFKTGEGAENASLMTEFVGRLKSRIDELSARYGKKILLTARVPIDPEFCRSEGLDVQEWIKLGLIDFLTVGHFLIADPNIAVAKFLKEWGDIPVPVYVSVDVEAYDDPHLLHSHGMQRGIASHIYAQGGDGIYLFNYFSPADSTETGVKNNVCRNISRKLLSEIGSMETLRKRNKIFALDNGAAVNYYRYRGKAPLPLQVSSAGQTVDIHVGDDIQADAPEQIILFLRTDRQDDAAVQVNGTAAVPLDDNCITLYNADVDLKQGRKVHAFAVPVAAVKQGTNTIGIRSQGDDFNVLRLEMAVRYGDVTTHGYF